MKDDTPIFDALKTIAGRLSRADVALMKRAIIAYEHGDELTVVRSDSRDVSPSIIESLKHSEGCRLTAYPDPGSRDGNPWTIGYGATGAGIARGVTWTQAQADARLTADIRRFEDQVEKVLGDTPTTQAQFDAFVHFAFNVGISAWSRSQLYAKHKAGDYAGAAKQFARWIYNDGKVLPGLVKRRGIEAAIYRGQA